MNKHPLVSLLVFSITFSCTKNTFSQQFREIRRIKPGLAQQAVAVDRDFLYVINNHSISKHRKADGNLAGKWEDSNGTLKHLNSGFIFNNKLYCAHSNYPESPMGSSVEIFDTRTLKHVGNHSFGIFIGSLTWINRHNGFWYAGFANYTGKGSSEGKDTRWTSVVRFNDSWQQLESWVFPETILNQFVPKSNSGAVWGKDGLLYCTGHDKPELYVLKIPESGFTLQLVKTIPTPSYGQGIDIEYNAKNEMILYGISKEDNQVIISELH
jgi:hypothetical protein